MAKVKYEGERMTYEQTWADYDLTAEAIQPDRCPHCGIGAVCFDDKTKIEDGSEYIIGSDCACTWCDAEWYDSVTFYGATPGDEISPARLSKGSAHGSD